MTHADHGDLPTPAEFDALRGLTGLRYLLMLRAPRSSELFQDLEYLVQLTEPVRLANGPRDGLLTRGLRAVLAHDLIFSFNRWGLPHRDQHILSNTAREIVMTDTTAPTDDNATAAREVLVDTLRGEGHIRTTGVEEAFRSVPRHVFVPNASLEAYANTTVSIKDNEDGRSISCASAPRIIAMMLEQATIEPGMRVLELGTGSGYNAALLARLVGPPERVTTIDVDQASPTTPPTGSSRPG